MTTAPHSGPETSRAAAESIEPHAGTLEALVLAAITFRGEHGATDEELQTALRMDANTERPRRWSLAKKGLIQPSGERRTRAGRRAQVWVAKRCACSPTDDYCTCAYDCECKVRWGHPEISA